VQPDGSRPFQAVPNSHDLELNHPAERAIVPKKVRLDRTFFSPIRSFHHA
jgi:hypothetical protein